MNKRLGIIGAGNMGGAIIEGCSNSGRELVVYDADSSKLKKAGTLPGVSAANDIADLVAKSDIIIIALKPNIFDVIVPEIGVAIDDLKLKSADANPTNSKIMVSIAAGISIKWLKEVLGDDTKVVRVMPNTPAMVGQGIASVTPGDNVSEEDAAEVLDIFALLGRALLVDEKNIETVTGISGSSPAYAYMYIQALMEYGMSHGLNEADSRTFAAQSTLGAAKMVLENPDVSPEQLRINVCSPGGATIEGVNSLEKNGFIETVKMAADASAIKAKSMAK